MEHPSSGTSYRVPYRRGSTPSFPPSYPDLEIPSLDLIPGSSDPSPAKHQYPESPTRTRSAQRRQTSHGRPEISLDDDDALEDDPAEAKKRRKAGGWSGKRGLLYLLMLGCVGLAAKRVFFADRSLRRISADNTSAPPVNPRSRSRSTRQPPHEDGVCRFVSPVEAYHRDLHRLRKKVANQNDFDLIYPINPNHTARSHHHKFSSTGHLLISDAPGSPHPIPLLLSLGEKRWEELLSRQSRTLGEAVREYERRYSRKPPKGFDIWWDIVREYDLILPDEYDRINLDLAPFWALPKKERTRRMQMVEEMKETFTLVIKDGQVDIEIKDPGGLKWEGTAPRAEDAASLVSAFAEYLPDMRATFSIFDQPQIYLSWARRGSLVELGLRGEHTAHLQETDDANVKLARSCAPDSYFRKDPEMSEGHSLIYDPLEAGDLCQNPYLVPLHGLTIEPHDRDSHPRPHTQLLPLFSLAKTSINSDILITPLDQFFDSPGRDLRWEDKRSSKLAWRGSPTGISMMTRDLPWRDAHRIRLHHFANNRSLAQTTYMSSDLGQGDSSTKPMDSSAAAGHDEAGRTQVEVGPSLGFKRESISRKAASTFFLDAKLAGKPIQCSEEDGTCEDMATEIRWAPHQTSEILNRHKFILDIDGNGWSGRFRRLMSTNSLVIKIGIFTEWFQPHLIPWFMYVPAKLDFSDMYDILAFFRGTPHTPDLGFDETAKALARNGKCFVERMFRIEDLETYMMRLFLEYARLAADEGEDMDLHYVDPEESSSGYEADGEGAGGDDGDIAM